MTALATCRSRPPGRARILSLVARANWLASIETVPNELSSS